MSNACVTLQMGVSWQVWGFNVTDASIGSIGPGTAVLTGTYMYIGGQVKLKLELDWFCSKCESEVIIVLIISNYIL